MIIIVAIIFVIRCIKFRVKKTFINLGKGFMYVWFLLGAVSIFRVGLPVAELSDFRKKPGEMSERGKLVARGDGLSYLARRKKNNNVRGGVEYYMVRDGKIFKLDDEVTSLRGGGVLVGAKDCFFSPKTYFLSQAREMIASSSPFEDDTIAQRALVKGVFYSGSLYKEVCGLLEEGLVERLPDNSTKKERKQRSPYPPGYGELFMWFECVRSAHPHGPGYYFNDCNKEWARLVPYLEANSEGSSRKLSAAFGGEELKVSQVELINPGDVPKGSGYKAAVN